MFRLGSVGLRLARRWAIPFWGATAIAVAASFFACTAATQVPALESLSTGSFSYDVRRYGAKGDGVAKDTAALQATIDAAAHDGGGMVMVPPGKYVSGTIHLRSNVTLRLVHGATLVASADDADFDPYEPPPAGSISSAKITWEVIDAPVHSASRPDLLQKTVDNPDTTYCHYSLIVGDGVSNVSVDGSGTIDGSRTRRGGPKLIAFKNSAHLSVRGVTLRNAASYNISLIGADDVDLEGLRIVNGYADGIDADNSRGVRIANCYIDTWDDAICAKASLALGRRLSTEDLVVTNCILKTSNSGFKFGTESEGSLRNVTLSNCVIVRRDHGRAPISGIAITSVDGGEVDGVVVSNIVTRNVRTPIFLRLGNRGRGMAIKHPGAMRNITISNIVASDAIWPSSINGVPGFPIENVTLSNINVTATGGGRFADLHVPELQQTYPQSEMFGCLPAYSLYARHVDGLTVSNWQGRWKQTDLRPAAVFDEVTRLEIFGLRADTVLGPRPVVMLHNVGGALVEGVSVGQRASLLVGVSGNKSRGITVFGNDRHNVRREVARWSDGFPVPKTVPGSSEFTDRSR